MTLPGPRSPLPLPWDTSGPLPRDVSDVLRAAASEEEHGNRPIGGSIDLLRQAGLLNDDGATDPARTARALMQVGAANLGVGRLWEGHVNALFLIRRYGSEAQKDAVARRISKGAMLGVWGADGKVPVTMAARDGSLTGGKCFASGLGTVTHALVTVNSGPDVRLALVDVTDMSRADPSAWNMRGMQATASGTYDFTDLAPDRIAWIGAAGDYVKEPHFVGGVWRIAALQVGAATGLLDVAATWLRSRDRMQAEAQRSRLMTVLTRAWAGIALVERAAEAAANHHADIDNAVAASIAARLFTEEVGLDAIRAVEQSIGLQHFETGSETGRMARDLSVYLRQAARDAFLQRAAQTTFDAAGNIWGVFE